MGSPADVFVRLEGMSPLDPIVGLGRKVVGQEGPAAVVSVTAHKARRWLGHPAHPAFARLSWGLLMSAAVADWLPHTGVAVPGLTAGGLVTAVPAAVLGAGDWAELSDQGHARAGVVHAGLNTVVLASFSASLLARAGRRRVAGRALTLFGASVLGVSGAIGGHIANNATREALDEEGNLSEALNPGNGEPSDPGEMTPPLSEW